MMNKDGKLYYSINTKIKWVESDRITTQREDF